METTNLLLGYFTIIDSKADHNKNTNVYNKDKNEWVSSKKAKQLSGNIRIDKYLPNTDTL